MEWEFYFLFYILDKFLCSRWWDIEGFYSVVQYFFYFVWYVDQDEFFDFDGRIEVGKGKSSGSIFEGVSNNVVYFFNLIDNGLDSFVKVREVCLFVIRVFVSRAVESDYVIFFFDQWRYKSLQCCVL